MRPFLRSSEPPPRRYWPAASRLGKQWPRLGNRNGGWVSPERHGMSVDERPRRKIEVSNVVALGIMPRRADAVTAKRRCRRNAPPAEYLSSPIMAGGIRNVKHALRRRNNQRMACRARFLFRNRNQSSPARIDPTGTSSPARAEYRHRTRTACPRDAVFLSAIMTIPR